MLVMSSCNLFYFSCSSFVMVFFFFLPTIFSLPPGSYALLMKVLCLFLVGNLFQSLIIMKISHMHTEAAHTGPDFLICDCSNRLPKLFGRSSLYICLIVFFMQMLVRMYLGFSPQSLSLRFSFSN